MNINFLNNQSIQKIANLNTQSQKIAFKGIPEDSFEKTTKTEENPNTAFLRDTTLTHAEKMKMLKELLKLHKIK